jgi:superfamily II RNA helicase
MVIICKDTFKQDEVFQEHFEKFPFPLSDFQKYAIKAIVEGDHILVTAHTGSGKTLPAEFAIEHFVAQGKKVIYTSPIKALSNQKFYEFTKKFPNISFGILTGDIKFNPEADVLIMTTEILRNTLLQKSIDTTNETTNVPLQFEMDFQNELGAVVFDEIHYINDLDRGKIWEETIMLLPSHVQFIMLSATIDKSEVFAQWIEDVKKTDTISKTVYLAPTTHRVVPLKHYFYTTIPQGPFKNIKDKEFIKFINEFLHKPIILKDSSTTFNRDNYNKVNKLLSYINKNNVHIKPAFVLNELTKYLNQNDMLPAICFVFSRKMVERYAQNINISLFEEDSTIPSTIKRECEQILRKLPNFKEYINLPEFDTITRLLEKGVAIHHSGIMPIFREMIELLFSKGYIKLLFATETFAVGINMPTKTVIFTGFDKFNGSNMRMIYPHEYTQMAGRAGRRGLDTIGHVVHLNNMFSLPYVSDYEQMVNGNPQTLQSKFNISYNLILNFLQYNNSILDFATKSMCSGEIQKRITGVTDHIVNLKDKYKTTCENPLYSHIISNKEIYEKYLNLVDNMNNSKQKIRKQIQRDISNILDGDKNFKKNLEKYKSLISSTLEITECEKEIESLKQHFHYAINNMTSLLHNNDFLVDDDSPVDKSICATYIQETHCLAFTDLLVKHNYFENFNAYEIASILSCFSNIRIKDDARIHNTHKLTNNDDLNNVLLNIKNIYENYITEEQRFDVNPSNSLDYIFELVNPILNWCESTDEQSCKAIIQKCEQDNEIFTGEFIKAILKINNMVNELKNIAEYTGNIQFLHKLTQIPELTSKFIATNQSLYI